VIIPKEIRERLRRKPGTTLKVSVEGKKIVLDLS